MAAKHRKRNTPWQSAPAERGQPKICSTSGKRMYASEAEAKATAAHQMSQKESAPVHLRTYRCLYCGAWHLTSKKHDQ
jgi:hypothetical protein